MTISEIRDQKQWNNFLLSLPAQAGIFLQSWEWLGFQEKVGRKIWRIGITSAGQQSSRTTKQQDNTSALVGVCGIIKHNLPLGKSYLYSPRGPVFDQNPKEKGNASNFAAQNLEVVPFSTTKSKIQNGLVDYVQNLAKEEGATFWRCEPPSDQSILRPTSYVLHSSYPVQPKQTLIIDLNRTEDELLSAMHEKTRYNIRLASRRGVEIRNPKSEIRNEFEKFWQLLKETAKRDQFSIHPRQYYENMLQILGNPEPPALHFKPIPDSRFQIPDSLFIRLHLAYQGTTPVAGAVVSYFGDTATYLHGASSYKHRALMSPYALHWHIMQEAKNSGYRFYDFWGIDEKKWPGITRFKLGFGGTKIDYPGTFDLPLNKFWYTLYRLSRKIL